MKEPIELDFNPQSLAFVENPWPVYRHLQANAPLHFHKSMQGWFVSRYDDVMRLIRDDRLSTSFYDWEFAPAKPVGDDISDFDRLLSNATFQLKHQDHQRIRRLVSPAFAPRVQHKIERQLKTLADELFQSVPHKAPFDYVTAISRQMPAKSIARIIGIAIEDEAAFEKLVMGMTEGINPLLSEEIRQHAINGISEGIDLLRHVIDERRTNPQDDDFLSQLILAEEEGEKLSHWELIALIAALVAAGADTAGQLHTQLIVCLHRNPSQAKLLHKQPDLIQAAITETLRFDFFKSPGQLRYMLEDVDYGGVTFKAGQMVILSLGSAHRDPDIFENPDQFIIERDQSASHVFSMGPHYCMGAVIARAQGEAVWRALNERFPNYRIISEPLYDPQQGMAAVELMVSPR
ncbi:Epothilone C/D epoxidase [BD1-7 clade bacterium]|uniref:Epothilone C/D epoxidase n=1 Tax=BD1-7 clade bacterium TaxID=2029982 RepID=A0A5S9MX87_9GAMM|nr:Epothilone C/D epoxidase [BD1-7 clade bacterium]CAA0083041.1 Epothilone C/D epoxidase [BD1-7 clade bacterium]